MKNNFLKLKRGRDASEKIYKLLYQISENLVENEINAIKNKKRNSSKKNHISNKNKSIKTNLKTVQNYIIIPRSKSISLREEEENNLSELVCKLNYKNTGTECFLCKKDISKNIKFLCRQCNKQIFCINCFLAKKHPIEHKYQIIDNLNFPLFTEDWKMSEEYKLLVNVSICGLDNWEDISNAMGNRGKNECESHYYSFYYPKKSHPMPKEGSIIIDKNKKIIREKLEINKNKEKNKLNECELRNGNPEYNNEENYYRRKGRYLCLNKIISDGEASSAGEILGYWKKRNEFEIEFLNDIEIEMGGLEFEENENEEDLQMKYDILKDYNLRLKEREERKRFVFEKGLLDLRRQNRVESKLSREEFELLLILKPFARFYENSEFFDLFEGLAIEQKLKLILDNINKLEKKNNQKERKINNIEGIENYFDIDHNNVDDTNKLGHLFNNILESKNIMNFLGNRIERFLEYQRVIDNKDYNKIFDDDEFELVKEMPLARSAFYDIKKRINNLVNKFNDKDSFSHNFMKLLGLYDLEIQTKNDIHDFYIKKFENLFIKSNKKNHGVNSNLDKMNNNNLIDIEEDLYF